MWNDSQDEFVKVIRFENLGFNTKPYNSSNEKYGSIAYCHGFVFNFFEVTDIDNCTNILPANVVRVKPSLDDTQWSGCFAFLEYYDPKILEGILYIKNNHMKNVALISRYEKVWVRNVDYRENVIFQYADDLKGNYLLNLCEEHDWVMMSVENALKRTKKSVEYFGCYKESITEVYLMEEQVKNLLIAPENYPLMSIKELLGRFFTSKFSK